MKVIAVILRILLLIVALAVLALALGTMVPAIPFVGSIGAYIVLGGYRYFIPAVTACFVLAVILFAIRRKALLLMSAVCLVATVCLSCVCLSSVIMTYGEEGVEVDVTKTYDMRTSADVRLETVSYLAKETGDLLLDVYYVEDEVKDKPVIVYVHGGGWISGSRLDHAYYSRKYAEAGYVAVSIDYTLSTETRHCVDGCEREVTAAFAWVKANIAAYGGSTAKLYVTGDSAGGNLALDVSYKINDEVYTDYEGAALPKVTAVAVTYPVAYPSVFWANDDLVLGSVAKAMCEQYTGTKPEASPEVYDGITPADYIDAFTPPTMVIVGKADTMVQPEQSYDLIAALEKGGIDNRLVAIPYLNHGFDTMDGDINSQGVLALTLAWFAAHP